MNLHKIKQMPMVYKTLLFGRRVSGRAFMRLQHGLHGIAKKKVFFSSFSGRSYSDSPRAISEALHALRPDLEIVWQLTRHADRRDLPDYVRVVPARSLQSLKELSTARCFVDNFNRPHYLLKFRDQLYVQTWHGDRGFKKVLYDMEDGVKYPDYKQMDLAVSGSAFGTKVYRSAFRYAGEVMQVGMPRNDALVNPDPDRIARVKARLRIPGETRVMLYAPTFRDATAGQAQQAGFDLGKAMKVLERATGKQWICLTRAHDQNRGIAGGDQAAMDVTAYPEMTDLLLAADLLVTDYSSSASDFVLLDRPAILYQPDLKEFMRDDRRMYFDLRRCPHLRAESEDALMRMLEDFDRLPKQGQAVLKFYGANETGRSAHQVAQWIAHRID